jgi:hypothetical protein
VLKVFLFFYFFFLCLFQQVLIALRYFASGSFLQVIGDAMGLIKARLADVFKEYPMPLLRRQTNLLNGHLIKKEKLSKVSTNVEGFLVSLDV